MAHSEAEDRVKQLEARKETIRRILSKHSAESTYPDCLRDFLVDCIYLCGIDAVECALAEAVAEFNVENPYV